MLPAITIAIYFKEQFRKLFGTSLLLTIQCKKITWISPPLLKYGYGMRLFLTRSRERFVCRCWSPRIHWRFCCSRRWLSRSPRVNIFGQSLSCGCRWCCPRVNRSSWFGTCRRSSRNTSQSYFTLESFPWRLISFISHSCQLILDINKCLVLVSSASGILISLSICHTYWTTSTSNLCARQMNKTNLLFETEHIIKHNKQSALPTRK